tara:strand:- start:326 stop:568 length:243 start_codon:yes stop_codon:yes gene_type:complete
MGMNPIQTIKGWAKEIVDLSLVLIAFGVVVTIIFGSDASSTWYFGQITSNLIAFINDIGNNNMAGVVALLVIIYAFSKRN